MKKAREVSDVIIASDEQMSDEEKQKYSSKKKHHREMKIASKKNRSEEGSQKKRHHLDPQRRSSSDPKLKSQFHSLLLSLSSDNDDDVAVTSSSKLKSRQSRVKKSQFGSSDNRKRKRIPDNLKSDSSGSDVKTKLDDVIDTTRKPRRFKDKVAAPHSDEKKKSGKMRAKRRSNEHQLTDCSDNDVINNSPLRSKPMAELDACDVTGSHKKPKPPKSRLVSKSNKQAMKIAAKKAAKSKMNLKTFVTSSPHVTNRKSEVTEMTSAASKLMTSRLLDSPKSPLIESKEAVKRNYHPLMKGATLTSSSASSSDDEASGKLHLSRTLTEEEQKKLLGFKRMTSLSSKEHKRVIEKKQSHDDVINPQDRDSREDERKTHVSSREPSSGIKDRRLSWMRDKLMTSERPRVKKQLPVMEKARTSSTSSVKEKLKKDWLASSVPSVSCRFDKASMRASRSAVKERHRVVTTEARHNLQHFRKSLDSRFRENFPKRFEHTKSANWNRHLSLDSATVMSSSTDDVTSSKRAPLHSTFNDGLSEDERPPVAKPETFSSSSSNSPPSSDQLKLEIDEDSSYFDQSVTKPKTDDVSIGDDNTPRYHGNLFARNEQLSRERDEEAVRSIMGGNTEIGVVAMDESMEDDVTETMTGNEVGLEGRSEEDEQELAAAVSSIFEDATCVGEDVYMLDVVKKAPPVQESQRIEGKLLDPFIFQTRRDEDVAPGRSLINHEKKFTNKFDISLQSANVTTEPEDSNLLQLPQSFICSTNDEAVCKENEKDSVLKSASDLDGLESPMSEEQQLLIDEDSYGGHLIDFQSQSKQNKNSLGNICDKYSKDIQFPHYMRDMVTEGDNFALQNKNEDLQKTIHEKQKKRKQQEELKRRQIEEQKREEQEEIERRKFEEQQRKEQEELQRRQMEEQKRKEQEELNRRQFEEQKRKEQEELNRKIFEEQQKKEQEELKRRQIEEQKRKEQEEKIRRQFEEEKRKQEEYQRMVFEEQKRKQEEYQRRMFEEQEELKRRQFEEQKRKQEEYQRRMFEEQKRKEQEELKKRQFEEQKRKEQEELKRRQMEEQKRKEQEEFQRRQFEEQKRKEQEELKRRQMEEQKRKEQEEFQRRQFEEQKRKEQEESERRKFEELKRKEQEELKRRQFEEQKRKEQEELKKRQIEEQKRKEQEEFKRRQFEEQKRKEQEELERRQFEEQRRKQEEYQRRLFEEQQRKEQEELKRRQFEEQKRKQEEFQRHQEEIQRRQVEDQKRKQQQQQFEMLEKTSQLQHSHLHNQIKTDKDDVKMKRLSTDNTGATISEHIQRQQTTNVHDLIKYSPVVNPTSYNIPSNAVFSYDFKDKNLPTNSSLIKSVYGSLQPTSDLHESSDFLSRHNQKLTSQHSSSTYETFNFPSTKAFPVKTTCVAEQSCCATTTNIYKQNDKNPQNINKIQLTNICCEQPTSLSPNIGAKKKIEDSVEERRLVSSPYNLQNNSRRCSPNTEIEKVADERSNAGSRRASKEFISERKNCEKQEKQSSKHHPHPETQSRCNSQLIQHLHMAAPHLIHTQPRCPQQQRVPLLHHTSQLTASSYLSDLRPFTSQVSVK